MVKNKLKILLEISHPARVHLFRNFYKEATKLGHDIKVVVIHKESTIELLKIYDIPYEIIGINRQGTFRKAFQLVISFILLINHCFRFGPDVFVGGASPILGFVSFLFRKPYVSFSDTEHAKLTWQLTKPFITKIVTPQGFLKNFGKKHIRFEGFKELAYLHPNYFQPDSGIYKLLNLPVGERYVFLRFISWGAHHDIGHSGISNKIKIEAVKEFSKTARVFISGEGELPQEIEKYRIQIPIEKIHHVLYYASLYFGESGTMATESAILGTPTVRVSTLAKLLGNFKELNEKYKLVEYFDSDETGYQRAKEILNDPNSEVIWRQRAKKLLDDKIDVTKFMVNFVLDRSNYG